jgi:hypothetical protein
MNARSLCLPPPHRFTATCASSLGLAILLVATLASVGCSDGRPKRVPVSGTVLIDGKPLTTGFIRVCPDHARPAVGQLDAQGRFTLTTFDSNDGCVVGTHRVEVVAYEKTASGVRLLAPEKYKDMATSGLTVNVNGPTDSLLLNLTWEGQQSTEVRAETQGDADPTKLKAE